MTALDLIERAMRIVGNTGVGEPLEADIANDALETLNSLIEFENLESAFVWNKPNESFTTVASQSNYTIGTGMNFNTSKPIRIHDCVVTYQSVDYPVVQLTQIEYDQIQYKAQTAPFPTHFLYQNGQTNGNIIFWPVPTSVLTATFNFDAQISQLAALSTVISWPQGYTRFFTNKLAIELALEYGKEIDPMVVQNMLETKASIQRVNQTIPVIQFDPDILGYTHYNIITDRLNG